MSKGIKIFSIILLITLIIFQYSVISNAANDEGATQSEAEETATDEESSQTEIILKTDSNKIKKGEEIKVYIYLNNAKLEDGINGCEGSISYDKEVLEPITQNDISYNGWNTTWNTENGMIIIQRNNITAEKQEVAELIFKVKKDTTAESTDIKFSNIVVSDGFEEDDEIEDATLKLTITEAETENPGNEEDNKQEQEKPSNGNSDGNNDNNGNSNNNSDSNNNDGDKKEEEQQKPAVDNNNNSNGSSSNNKYSGTSEKTEGATATNNKTNNESLPKTGMNQWMIGTTGIILVLGIVSYIKYKKYKNI